MTENYKPIIEDSEEYFPERKTITIMEKKLILSQVIRYSTGELQSTLHPKYHLSAAIADSNIIKNFVLKCPDEYVDVIWMEIGAQLRKMLTTNRETLGMSEGIHISGIKPVLKH